LTRRWTSTELALTAPETLQLAHQVKSHQLAVSTDHLRFQDDTPSDYGAFDVTGLAAFDSLRYVTVAFDRDFDFVDGLQFDLIIAGSIEGLSASLFSIENLDPFFRYALTIEADAVRLSLMALDAHGVPEPTAGLLVLAALAAAAWVRVRRHRP
jgi:hypothetical protein